MVMIYRFQSKAAGDVIMLKPDGDAVLTAMGVRPLATGIIESQALPAAMGAIEAAIAKDEAQRAPQRSGDEDGWVTGNDDEPVSLRRRVWPLLDMMRRAHAAGAAVVWGV